MRRKNTKEILRSFEMYFFGFFQSDELIKFFILLRQAIAITWENFVPAKRDPGSTKVGPRFAGMKLFTCIPRI